MTLALDGCSRGGVSCGDVEESDTISVVVDVVEDSSLTKGVMVDEVKDMGSIALYCAYTGDEPWSPTTTFNRFSNQRLDYDLATSTWVYEGGAPTWGNSSITDKYTFCGYSPFDDGLDSIEPYVDEGVLKVRYSVSQSCAEQPDLMMAIPCRDIYPPAGGSVALSFCHTLASISFGVRGGATIQSIALRGIIAGGDVTVDDSGGVVWGNFDDRTSIEYGVDIYSGVTPSSDSSTQLTTDSGYLMMIPQQIEDVEVVVTTIEGDVMIYDFESGDLWEAGRHYHYTINQSESEVESDYTIEGTANCYMIHPTGSDQVIYIPVEGRINYFWRYYADNNETYKDRLLPTDEWSAEVLWYDLEVSISGFSVERVTSGFEPNESLVTPRSAPNFVTKGARSAMKITLPKEITEGNILIAVELDCDILWSWHLWITDYNPDEIVSGSVAQDGQYEYCVDGQEGAVHRYSDSGLWGSLYSGKFMMDRNLGSRGSEFFNKTGVVHYQFGRKDPFPIRSSESPDVETDRVSFAEAVQHPTTFYIQTSRPYSWCNDKVENSDQYLWDDKNVLNTPTSSGKSIFDPSPLGWRVPRNETYLAMVDMCEYYNSIKTLIYKDVVNLPMTGIRSGETGTVSDHRGQGNLRMSTPLDSSLAYNLSYEDEINTGINGNRSDGYCIRCIEE